MSRTISELAQIAGITPNHMTILKKRIGITAKRMTEEEEERLLERAKESRKLLDEQKEVLSEDIKPIDVVVREIDKSNGSSLVDMLQDTKERYVENEKIIRRLNNEINQMDKMFRGNSNGTFQVMPQLTALNNYQQVNIKLRNQIAEFEEKLGRIANDGADDPFQ